MYTYANRICPIGSIAYTIRSGDTLYEIARRYNVPLNQLLALNPGVDPANLQIGSTICIPSGVPRPCPDGTSYTIRAGDTLYSIAIRYNVTVEDLLNANPGIDPNRLMVGQVICIPRRPRPPRPCPDGMSYTIRPGDTLYSIAIRYNVTVEDLLDANPGIDPNRLMVGQIICIPR